MANDKFYQSDYAKLLCHLEYIVGKHCYNKNFNGGMSYRYPVKYVQNGQRWVTRGGETKLQEKEIDSMYYEFGTNRLYIGEALDEILKYLMEHYSQTEDFEFGPDLWDI